MSVCEYKSEKQHLILLLFGSVGFGALTSLIIAILFFLKWKNEFEDAYKRKSVPKLCALAIVFLLFERISRILEYYFMYNSSKLAYNICYHVNSILGLGGIFGTLFLLLSTKLISSFETSTYRVSDTDKRILYGLSIFGVLFIQLFWTLNGIPSLIRLNLIGLYIQPAIALIGLILGLTVLGKVNFGFASRMRALVASEASTQTDDPNPSPVAQSPSSKGRANSPRMFHNMDEKAFSRRASIAAIRRSSVSFYESGQRRLLKTAAKNEVIVVWITFSFILSFISGIFFALNGRSCASWILITGNGTIAVAFLIMGISVCFSVHGFDYYYSSLCAKFDHLVQRVVAFQTTRQVLELSEIPDSPTSAGSPTMEV